MLPLPTIPVAGETKEEIAEQAAMGFQLLAIASGKKPEDLYKVMDLHLTDSVSHNKFLSEAAGFRSQDRSDFLYYTHQLRILKE